MGSECCTVCTLVPSSTFQIFTLKQTTACVILHVATETTIHDKKNASIHQFTAAVVEENAEKTGNFGTAMIVTVSLVVARLMIMEHEVGMKGA